MYEPNLTIYDKPLKRYGRTPQYFFFEKFIAMCLSLAFVAVFYYMIPLEALEIAKYFLLIFGAIGVLQFFVVSKAFRLKKNGKKIRIGMHIDEVREILMPFNIEKQGFTESGKYCVKFHEKELFNGDFETLYLVFEDNRLVDKDIAYRRTTTTTTYY